MPSCLILSIIRQIKGKWNNPENRVASSLTPQLVAIEKGAFRSPSDTVRYDYQYQIGIPETIQPHQLTPGKYYKKKKKKN